jgi:hypothetical protein
VKEVTGRSVEKTLGEEQKEKTDLPYWENYGNLQNLLKGVH